MNRPFNLAVLVNIILIAASPVQAEDTAPNFLNKFKRIQKSFQEGGRDLLQETFNKMNQEKNSDRLQQMGIHEQEIADTLKNLPNPFLPQTPVSKEKKLQDTNNQTGPPVPGIIEPKHVENAEPETPEIPQPQYIISGLIWNSDRPQAILDGQIVNEGDKIQIYTIKSITKKGVELTVQDKSFFIEPQGAGHANTEYDNSRF